MTSSGSRQLLRTCFVAAVAAALPLFAGLGCSGGDVGASESGELSVSPDPVTFGQVGLGETASQTLTIRNSGEDALRVFEMKLKPKGNASIESLSIPELPEEGFTLPADETRKLEVQYAPKEAGAPNAGILEIYNSDPEYGENEPHEVEITTLGNTPEIQVSPRVLRFPLLNPGDSVTRTATITNVGEAPLTIYEGMTISGSEDYQIKSIDKNLPYELEPIGDGSKREERTVRVDVQYKPTKNGSTTAELVIKSNEDPSATPDNPKVERVEINANADTPCLRYEPVELNLGAVPIGGSSAKSITVKNCGTKSLRISQLRFSDETSDEFSLDLGTRDGDGDGSLDQDLVLADQGEEANIPVLYQPTQAGADGGTLEIHSNDTYQEVAEVPLVARGATGECPNTVIRGRAETGTVWDESVVRAAPLDYVLLDASESADPDGRIVDYEFRAIEKPEGATVNFEPWKDTSESNEKKRRFRLLVAGDYKIGLKVKDNDGFFSCEEAILEVSAEPDEKVHVELTWENPKDPDQHDDNGDDVDVHLVKMGPGKWFGKPYDIYYDNPNRGSTSGGSSGIWQPESPSLDIDDRNSLGPENIQMDDPQDCQWYAVGVHYFEERYAPAYATVRVYLGENKSNLVFEKTNIELEQGGNFWDVARIHWPTRTVFPVGRIYDDEAAVRDDSPKVTQRMKDSGLCTSQNLYSTQ